MNIDVEAYCLHLKKDHSISGIGAQRFPATARFDVADEWKVVKGAEGVCLSSDGACNHLCKKIILARRSMSMALNNPDNPVQIDPQPPIEPKET